MLAEHAIQNAINKTLSSMKDGVKYKLKKDALTEMRDFVGGFLYPFFITKERGHLHFDWKKNGFLSSKVKIDNNLLKLGFSSDRTVCILMSLAEGRIEEAFSPSNIKEMRSLQKRIQRLEERQRAEQSLLSSLKDELSQIGE